MRLAGAMYGYAAINRCLIRLGACHDLRHGPGKIAKRIFALFCHAELVPAIYVLFAVPK
jgi:hypothetical protein